MLSLIMTDREFAIKVGYILSANKFDDQKLKAINLVYKLFSFPEFQLQEDEIKFLDDFLNQ